MENRTSPHGPQHLLLAIVSTVGDSSLAEGISINKSVVFLLVMFTSVLLRFHIRAGGQANANAEGAQVGARRQSSQPAPPKGGERGQGDGREEICFGRETKEKKGERGEKKEKRETEWRERETEKEKEGRGEEEYFMTNLAAINAFATKNLM